MLVALCPKIATAIAEAASQRLFIKMNDYLEVPTEKSVPK
jgi:hypothetical protein